jgi:CBS domain-containing protein
MASASRGASIGAMTTASPSRLARIHVAEVARTMAEHDVSHLVVVGAATDRPEGVLSTLGIAAVLASNATSTIQRGALA